MGHNNNQACPQCLHLNPTEAAQCSLCDWPLRQQSDATVTPADMNNTQNPDLTIAPQNTSQQDPDATVAPHVLNEQKKSAVESSTFQLAGDLAHFEIQEIIGQGGMGTVYQAKDRILQRDVAIKMLRPMAASSRINTEALLDEARMASKLNHPNIVTIYDVARTEDSNYIVMEWVDGQPLDELIPDEGLPLETALEYACQIADGLASAHQKYLIHRDIKPQNIMLSAQNNIKILDFGIAGFDNHQVGIDQTNSQTPQTSPGIGTPSYMSPEQAQGQNLDQRSDIFSFGIVMYQMLSGKRPFIGKNSAAVQKTIISGEYVPIQNHLPNIPAEVIKLLDQMLEVQRDERWQTTAELSAALHAIHGELTHTKNWWQRQHWALRVAMLLPFILGLGWSVKDILFPATTQQLIERQLAEANKIAILPFENISGDPLIQLFGDGLAVNLGSDLTAIAQEQGNTWIVPSTEISRMKEVTPKAVADKYGVDLILTGSMQHMGSTRLLVLNLLNAQTGQQVNTTEIEIDANELFDGYDLVRSEALDLLGWAITNKLDEKFQSERPKLDGAYKYYVEGRGYLYRFDQSENISKALKSFQKAIEIDPNYYGALVGIIEVWNLNYLITTDTMYLDKVMNDINRLETIDPTNAEVNFLRANVAYKKGNYDLAIEYYKSVIKIKTKHVKSIVGLANSYSKKSMTSDAIESYEKALDIAPNNWLLVSDFGIFYYYNGNYENALVLFKRLINLSDNNHFAYRLLAAAEFSLGETERAIINTKKAIELLPSDEAYANLGTMLFSVKNYESAVEAYLNALEINNTSYLIWGNLADGYKLSNNPKSKDAYFEATQKAQKALETNPNDQVAIAHIAYYFANLNKKSMAINYAKQINQENSGLENYIVATAYDELDMSEEVFKHLNWAINKNYPLEEISNTPLLKNIRSHSDFHKFINE